MKLEFELDLNNPQHVLGMQAFFNAIVPDKNDTQTTLDLAKATAEEVEAAKPKRKSRAKASTSAAEKPVETSTAEKPVETSTAEKPVETSVDTTITIEMVRNALALKVADNKDAIKSKLQSFGAPNVTKLDKKHYAELMNHLDSLK